MASWLFRAAPAPRPMGAKATSIAAPISSTPTAAFTIFYDTSTAGLANIQNTQQSLPRRGNEIQGYQHGGFRHNLEHKPRDNEFHDNSNAGSANITNDNFGATVFQGPSRAELHSRRVHASAPSSRTPIMELLSLPNREHGLGWRPSSTRPAVSRSSATTPIQRRPRLQIKAPAARRRNRNSVATAPLVSHSITQIANIEGGITNFRGRQLPLALPTSPTVSRGGVRPGTLNFFDNVAADQPASQTGMAGRQTSTTIPRSRSFAAASSTRVAGRQTSLTLDPRPVTPPSSTWATEH